MKSRAGNFRPQDLTPSMLAGVIFIAMVLGCPISESVSAAALVGPDAGMRVAMQSPEGSGKKMDDSLKTDDASGKKSTQGHFEVSAGGEFTLTLTSNITTGYHWELAEPLDETIVKLVDSQYEAPKTNVVGAGGQEVWTFRGVGQGQTTINLKYVRPWEKDVPPEKTASYTLTVR